MRPFTLATGSQIHNVDLYQPVQTCQLGLTPLDTKLILAPMLFGTNLGWLLLGVILVQAHGYSQRSSNDSALFKAYVYTCIILQLGETALESVLGYQFLVEGWGNPLAGTCASDYQPLFNAVSGALVQNYFAWRILSFSKAIGGRGIRFLGGLIYIREQGFPMAIQLKYVPPPS